MTATTALELRDARVVLDGAAVVDDLSFALEVGGFCVLLGPNGSGKTTLVRAALGLLPLASGEARIFGVPLARFTERARIGYVPQRFTASAGVPATVHEVVLSGRIARSRPFRPFGADDRRAADRALELLDLTALAPQRVASLSGGQQQRVLVARALATEPDLLVLDEPASAIDIEHQERFAATLGDLHRGAATVLLVAHSLGALAPLVTRAVVLAGGRIVYDGPPKPRLAEDPHAHHAGDHQPFEAADRGVLRER